MLYTPGPLTTSITVKQAMLQDWGSRDKYVCGVAAESRTRLLHMAGVSKEAGYECVLQPGSGTFVVETVVGSVVPPPAKGGRILVIANGAYGLRMAQMCKMAGIDYELLEYPEQKVPTTSDVVGRLKDNADRPYTHVGIIHHETSAGTLNPVELIGAAIKEHDPNISYIVDSMSGFGAHEVDMQAGNIHYLISSANKNIEGVPGFGFALCRRDRMEKEGVNARSVSLDLLAQWKGMEATGQFRFTPPVHALMAFRQALDEHEAEGGCAGRLARYRTNSEILRKGMADMGMTTFVPEEVSGFIIATFLCPDDPNFDFDTFYNLLSDRGMQIYPGKLANAECFRVANIGRIYPHDMRNLLSGIRETLLEMGLSLPVKQVVQKS